MIVDILISYLLQIVLLFGPILLFGFLIYLCNKHFYANFGSRSRAVCYVTGFIGTPVHELSHALMCLLFGHRIVQIKFFQVGSEDGTLGYVLHTYNKRNIYQRIGNFFIGIAPILVISAFLFLIAWLLMPAMVGGMTGYIHGVNVSEGVVPAMKSFARAIGVFFTYASTWQWWVFIAIGMFLALHMTLSGADIKGALSGLLLTLVIFLVVDVILALVSASLLDGFTAWLMGAAGYMICFMTLALIIDLFALIISLPFRALRRR